MNTLKLSLEELVLATLSFFDPMTFSQIILDFDLAQVRALPDFDKEQLQKIIDKLEKKKLIKQVVIDKEAGWIRIHRKRYWWKKISLTFFQYAV